MNYIRTENYRKLEELNGDLLFLGWNNMVLFYWCPWYRFIPVEVARN
jgi:hypothetical protein